LLILLRSFLVFSSPPFFGGVFLLLPIVFFSEGPDLSHGFVQFRDLYVKNPLVDPLNKVKVSSSDVALEILKDDKWIPISQEFVTSTAEKFANAVGFSRSDRVNVNLPLHTLTGKIAGIFGVLSNLSVIVIPSQTFDAKATLKAVQEERCNVLLLSTAQLEEVLKQPKADYKQGLLEKVVVVKKPSTAVRDGLLSSAKDFLHVSDIKVASISPSGDVTVA
jgi:hypothetical protein